MKSRLAILVLALVISRVLSAQTELAAGPMAGYSTMREVAIWLQLKNEGRCRLVYEHEGTKTHSEWLKAETAQAFALTFTLPNLDPGTTYQYAVEAEDGGLLATGLQFATQPLWQYRTEPPTFTVLAGSCAYINEEQYDRPGKPYGSHYEIFESMAALKPDYTLWLGDNVYLREADWSARSGYLHRYSHARATPELQPLLRSGHHYAIWDDHDFGPNDANGNWIHKEWALDAFKLFWPNPSFGMPDLRGAITAFRLVDIDFFLLDNRTHRSAPELNEGKTTLLGKRQIDWLIESLVESRAPFKLVAVGGQVLNTAAEFENHAVYAEERNYLLRRLSEEKIKGVIFMTGDRHHTELSKITLGEGIDVYDLTVSPLTSGVHNPGDEANTLRVPETLVTEHNFAELIFTGPRTARQMQITIRNAEGTAIWTKTLDAPN